MEQKNWTKKGKITIQKDEIKVRKIKNRNEKNKQKYENEQVSLCVEGARCDVT